MQALIVNPDTDADDLLLEFAHRSPLFNVLTFETKVRAVRDVLELARSMQRRGQVLTVACGWVRGNSRGNSASESARSPAM